MSIMTNAHVIDAVIAIDEFVKEHGDQLSVVDITKFTLAFRQMEYYECVIGSPGLFSIDVGTTKQLVRVRSMPGVFSNELTDMLIARIHASSTWAHKVPQ
ncbi:MAG: hypothetical protein Q7R47_05260 [Candidatus Diapherotrites archaeon]|nr:hypothetical protein [Candidatus Diapherotrites archaeon]